MYVDLALLPTCTTFLRSCLIVALRCSVCSVLSQFAFIYIFNLIVAFGVLALPFGFSQAGLIISTILMVILCFLAYITATYVIEAMSVANALQRHRKRTHQATPELQKGNASVSHTCESCARCECDGCVRALGMCMRCETEECAR